MTHDMQGLDMLGYNFAINFTFLQQQICKTGPFDFGRMGLLPILPVFTNLRSDQ